MDWEKLDHALSFAIDSKDWPSIKELHEEAVKELHKANAELVKKGEHHGEGHSESVRPGVASTATPPRR